MGIAIARELSSRGADVTLVAGPISEDGEWRGIRVKHVQTARQMHEACLEEFASADITVMAAAVADYAPVDVATEKIKKKEGEWTLHFTKTPDILKSLGEQKKNGQVLVGFALETSNERENATKKLESKNADLIVLNSLRDPGAGFGHDTNKVTIFDRKGNEQRFGTKSKADVAKDIVDAIIRYRND
jgi:phosphopantothenoylcysteine decarboxylase/phosphopantothenate--cysteine ligase